MVTWQYWSEMVMEPTLDGRRPGRFSDPDRLVPGRPGARPGHARGHRQHSAVLQGPVRARRHPHELGESRAERAEGGAADLHARVGHAHARAQQRHRPLDPPGHEVAVRRLAVGRPKRPGEVPRRHQRVASHGRHVERTRILPIDQIPRPAQVRKVGKVLLVHGTRVSTAPATVLLTCRDETWWGLARATGVSYARPRYARDMACTRKYCTKARDRKS